jgi:hypothetical protein
MIRRAAGFFVLLLLLAGCVLPAEETSTTGSTSYLCSGTTGSTTSLNESQLANAKAIIDVALGLGLGPAGAKIGVAVAMTESTLNNINFGDIASSGQMTSSRGLFQQKAAWGPLVDRTDPAKAATMFFTGGQAGQEGLMDIEGWQQMSPHVAAQAVQKSQFSDGSNFAKHMALAETVITDLGVADVECEQNVGTVLANGSQVTIPSSSFVAPEVQGKAINTSSEGLAKGLAAGFGSLGLPYTWGGGGSGEGPNDGCTRGGGQLNSCQGIIGFDCSGLTAYVMVQGGFGSPGGNSGTQRNRNKAVAWDQRKPGDIIGFPGHVAVYLGDFNGKPYVLEASTVGVPVHIVALTRSDRDSVVYRYWSSGATV